LWLYNLLPQELLASVAPKKVNWDLKREVEPRLAKLERRTQRALVEMLLEEEQQRLQQEGGVAD
jgi:coiled-coil domain-containing protein 12